MLNLIHDLNKIRREAQEIKYASDIETNLNQSENNKLALQK